MATVTDQQVRNIWSELSTLDRQSILRQVGVSVDYAESPIEFIPLTGRQVVLLGSATTRLMKNYGVELIARNPTRDQLVYGASIRDRIRTPLNEFLVGKSSTHQAQSEGTL